MDALDDETGSELKTVKTKIGNCGNRIMELFSAEITKQKLDYLHLNPLVSDFITKAEEHLNSIAIDWYSG